jgi:hypothetical protein
MSDWYEVNKGEHYRHVLTRGLVRVVKVRWQEGMTGFIYWEAVGGAKIDGTESGVQEAQHFLEDFYLVHLSPSIDA